MMDCSRLFFSLSLSFSSPTYLLGKREESHDREKEKSHRPMMDPHNNNGRRRRREREREREREKKERRSSLAPALAVVAAVQQQRKLQGCQQTDINTRSWKPNSRAT
jgi:hypothetical protein